MTARDYRADPIEILRRDEDLPPPAGAQARVLALLSASSFGAALGGNALGGGAAGFAGSTLRQLARRFATWSLLPLAAGVVIGASGHALLSAQRTRRALPAATTGAPLTSAWLPVRAAEPAERGVDTAPSTSSNRELSHQGPSVDSLAEERAVLDRARQKLAVSEPEHALQFLEQHARRYPNGTLTEEREAMLISVQVSLGRAEQAKARGAAFMKRFPSSLMLASVKAALAANSAD